ncbi:hypothetical protein GWI33_010283 [Rhynchophorus ferrugineus]|uniref:Uncharacterized protein n=1 Tax=Rhynchophorus ferrugineus TaxID=354439 RepID=A0A834IBZ1_RHYFE|nr:hypothetical protein GWI33_010283 [Rhynchophorus ferrugineus]
MTSRGDLACRVNIDRVLWVVFAAEPTQPANSPRPTSPIPTNGGGTTVGSGRGSTVGRMPPPPTPHAP